MKYFFFIPLIILCLIYLVIIIVKWRQSTNQSNKQSIATIIERRGKFYKMVHSDSVFLIPLLDKIKCKVNLQSQIYRCYPSIAILNDNTTLCFQIDLFFRVTDAIKIAYLDKNLERQLEQLAITSFRDLVQKIDVPMKEQNLKLKEKLTDLLNETIDDLGCEIEKVEINLIADQSKISINDYPRTSVVNHTSKTSILKINLFIFLSIALYLGMVLLLQTAYYSTNHLLFYSLTLLLKTIPTFLLCLLISSFVCALFQRKITTEKKINRKIVFIGVLFLLIYSIMDGPSEAKISDGMTNFLNYSYATIKDLIANQTTTIDCYHFFTEYSSSSGRTVEDIVVTVITQHLLTIK